MKTAEETPPPHEQMESLKSKILKAAVERIQVAKDYKVSNYVSNVAFGNHSP